MTRIALLLTIGLTAASLGCRTQCRADEKASREQVLREQKAVLRGQGTCLELAYPKIALTDARLVLTATKENVLARRDDIPVAEVKRIAPLDERLRGYREHFKQVRAADPFEPTLYVTLDPALEPAKAASVLATAAYAGYRRSRVYVGDIDLTLDWWVPPAEERGDQVALCVDVRSAGRFGLRFQGRLIPAREVASLEALGTEIAAACADVPRCASVVGIEEGEGATVLAFARVAKVVLEAHPLVDQKPSFMIATRAPMAGGWTRRASERPSPTVEARPCAR
jgi:hypothetical protein